MSRLIQLDARLSLAYDLYDPCDLAADIGTDHAHLPAALLQRGRCQHMILTGLQPLDETCGMISITGMGGRTVHDILLEGAEKLKGASLVLSAHTDLPLIREAVCRIGYHLDREEPCFCAGRYYLVLRARPGVCSLTPRELRLGGPLFESQSSQLIPYLTRRREVLQDKLRGLVSADKPEESLIAQVREDIAFYDGMIGKGKES